MRKVPLLLAVAGVLLTVMAFPVISLMTGLLCFDTCPSQGLGSSAVMVTLVPLLPPLLVALIAWADGLARAYRASVPRGTIAAWAALPVLALLTLLALLVEMGTALLPQTASDLTGSWRTFQISLVVLLCVWFIALGRYATWLTARAPAAADAPLPVKRR